MSLRLQPVQVATGSEDQESQLVFGDGFLVAILVRLSAMHGADAGRWHMEAGFGRIHDARAPTFADLDEAQTWITGHLPEPL